MLIWTTLIIWGQLAIGRVANGTAAKNEQLVCISEGAKENTLRASKVQVYEGFIMQEVEKIEPGEIMILAGIENVRIGDTICTKERPKALKRITVDEPTISMFFYTNTSPFAGQEGKLVQSNKIKERLYKETLSNVSLQFEEQKMQNAFWSKAGVNCKWLFLSKPCGGKDSNSLLAVLK